MTVKVKVEGGKKLAKLKSRSVRINDEVRRAILVGANMVQNDAKRALAGGGKTGIVYKKYNPKRTHQASAPGEAPATDLGNLINSIHIIAPANKHLHAFVVVEAEYAKWLEFGTKDGKIKKRPFLGPAFEKNKPAIRALIKAAYHRGMHKGN